MKQNILLLGDTSQKDIQNYLNKFSVTLKKSNQIFVEDIFSLKNENIPSEIDLAIVFGGDGTMLYTGRLLCQKRIPILGVNRGKLGFLTEISPSEFEKVIDQDLLAYFLISRCVILEVTLEEKEKKILTAPAINDIVISFHGIARIIPIRCCLNNEYITTYYGDGIIVSTPIGSTAYSLSAGGPIVAQEMEATLLTPICPHTLNNRPLVIPTKTQITLQIEEPVQNGVITIDGQNSHKINCDYQIKIRKYRYPFLRLKPPTQSFFKTIKQKLRWGESFPYNKGSSPHE